MKNLFIAFIALTFLAGSSATAQTVKFPAGSPLATVKQQFGISDVTVEYSRPSANNRVVFGDVVPLGKLWRTGANGASKITFGAEMKVNGKVVPAGTYSLFTIPAQNEWTIIINKNANLSGTNGYNEAEDVARFNVKTVKKADKVETFTIQFNNVKSTQVSLELAWENTSVSFDIVADYDAELMKSIDKAMTVDGRTYYQSATYYYENKKDLTKALEWANKAIETNPTAYWMSMLKAKIQLALNDKKGATATFDAIKKMPGFDEGVEKQINDLLKTAK